MSLSGWSGVNPAGTTRSCIPVPDCCARTAAAPKSWRRPRCSCVPTRRSRDQPRGRPKPRPRTRPVSAGKPQRQARLGSVPYRPPRDCALIARASTQLTRERFQKREPIKAPRSEAQRRMANQSLTNASRGLAPDRDRGLALAPHLSYKMTDQSVSFDGWQHDHGTERQTASASRQGRRAGSARRPP